LATKMGFGDSAILLRSNRASASAKALDQEGASPFQANVTGLNPTVTASS